MANKNELNFLKYELYYRWKFLEKFNVWYSTSENPDGKACYNQAESIFEELLKLYEEHSKTGGFIVEDADVSKNKDRRIYAVVQSKCSNKQLAEIVGLDEVEINKWLQEYFANGNMATKNIPFKDSEVKQGQCYTVPNVVVIINSSMLELLHGGNMVTQLSKVIGINLHKEGHKEVNANSAFGLAELFAINKNSIWGINLLGHIMPRYPTKPKKQEAVESKKEAKILEDVITAHYYRNFYNLPPKTLK